MKARAVIDVDALIERAGGMPALMSKLDVARTTILDWKRTGFIPASRVAQISAKLQLPLEDVVKLAQLPVKRRPRKAA